MMSHFSISTENDAGYDIAVIYLRLYSSILAVSNSGPRDCLKFLPLENGLTSTRNLTVMRHSIEFKTMSARNHRGRRPFCSFQANFSMRVFALVREIGGGGTRIFADTPAQPVAPPIQGNNNHHLGPFRHSFSHRQAPDS